MTVDIDLRPTEANIHEVAGADLSITVTCFDSQGDPVDVSGYTFAANVLRGGVVVESFSTAVSGDDSNIVTLTLSDTETAGIGTGTGLRWELKVTVAGVTDWWYAGDFELSNPGASRQGPTTNSLVAFIGASITATLNVGVGGAGGGSGFTYTNAYASPPTGTDKQTWYATGDGGGGSYVRYSGAWVQFSTPEALGGGGAVDSVNTQTGVVVLDADDIDDTSTTHKFATAAQLSAVDGLGTASTAATGDFATAAQGALAATATQPGDLGTLAAKNDIAVPADITATGTPSSSTYLRGDGAWATPAGGSGMTDPGFILLDDMAGANDDAKFGAALTAAAAADPIPWIMLPARTVTLSTPRTPFTGMKICGPSGLESGAQNYEIGGGANVTSDVNLTGSIGTGTSSMFYSTSTLYDINIHGLTFRSNNSAQFWHQPTNTLYSCSFRDLMFYGMRSVFGNTSSDAKVTLCDFSGFWTVNSGTTGDVVFHFGGSDNTFWKNGLLNLQNGGGASSAPTTKNNYQMIFNTCSKSVVGFIFVTSAMGWRGVKVSGSGESLVFEGSVIEGYSGSSIPAHGDLLRIEGGNVQLNNVFISQGMAAPTFHGGTTPNGVIEITGGNVAINGAFYKRGVATSQYGSVGAVAESVPYIYQSGGELTVRDLMGVGTWSGRPRYATSGSGSLLDWDNSVVNSAGTSLGNPFA